MNDPFDRNQFALDLSEFRVVWVGQIPFLMPNYIGTLQEKYLVASQMTLLLQNSSVDYFLKRWMKDFEEDRRKIKIDAKFILLDEILNFSRNQNSILVDQLSKIDFDPESVSSLAVHTTFSRLETTIKSIHFHLKFGYCFESFALIRLLLEQIAYAYTASKVPNEEPYNFLSPTESISHLKKIIPDAGRLYGILSKLSHIDKSTIPKYIEYKDGRVFTTQHSIYHSLEATMYYLKVLEYKNIIFEYALSAYLKEFKFIRKRKSKFSGEKFEIKANTQFKNESRKYISKIQELLNTKTDSQPKT